MLTMEIKLKTVVNFCRVEIKVVENKNLLVFIKES